MLQHGEGSWEIGLNVSAWARRCPPFLGLLCAPAAATLERTFLCWQWIGISKGIRNVQYLRHTRKRKMPATPQHECATVLGTYRSVPDAAPS